MPTKKKGRNINNENLQTQNKNESINIREKFINQQLTTKRKVSIWLWIGVGGLGLIIVFFWGYSLWSNVSSFNWKKTEESKIFEQSSTDLNKIFDENKLNELRNQANLKQVKELLRQNLFATTTLTNTTNTIDLTTTTTSTIITTSTIATTTKK